MNRQSMLGLTAAGLIGLATSVSFGIANGRIQARMSFRR
jgi:hypothetical protein